MALANAASARAVILVEGVSDQIALATVAARVGRATRSDGVVIVPVGGAHGMARYLKRFGPDGSDVVVGGLCDVAEEPVIRKALGDAGIGEPRSRSDLAHLGFFVCVKDLEDELIRATGMDRIEAILDSEGDLGSFRTMQRQPEWRDRRPEAQFRRFLGSGARRKLRYARLLVEGVTSDRIPAPLIGVLDYVYDHLG